MSFFRSPLLRRIIYALAAALALVRFANRSHAEPIPFEAIGISAIVSAADVASRGTLDF